jgi:hypothetical protein
MGNATTLVETMNALRKEGYTEDFNLKSHCIVCGGSEIDLHPDDFSIDQVTPMMNLFCTPFHPKNTR